MPEFKVSVCIPTYNSAGFLGETIESILKQGFSDFELLILDNQSSDGTRLLVESYARKDPRVRYLVNSCNLGMVPNWNRCLDQARGEYIKFVFADDPLAASDTLERMVSLLDAECSVSLVCSARNIIDERSRVLKIESHFDTGILPGADVITSCLVKNENLIGEPSSVMFRKAQAGRGFVLKYRQIVDLEMWFHLLENGSFAYIDMPLCSFRIHARQQTGENLLNLVHLHDFFYLRDEYLYKGYVALSKFTKTYLAFDHCYEIWKLAKGAQLERSAAVRLINDHYGFFKFRAGLPAYKLCRPFMKKFRKGWRVPG